MIIRILSVDQVAFSIYILQGSDFKNIESIDTFLSSQERQAIIFHLLNSIRAENGDAATVVDHIYSTTTPPATPNPLPISHF